MPPPRYEETRTVKLDEASDLLQGSSEWEIAERYPGGRLSLGRPRIRPRQGLALGLAVLKGPDAVEGVIGGR